MREERELWSLETRCECCLAAKRCLNESKMNLFEEYLGVGSFGRDGPSSFPGPTIRDNNSLYLDGGQPRLIRLSVILSVCTRPLGNTRWRVGWRNRVRWSKFFLVK